MSRYSSGDLPSLKELLKEYCQNVGDIWEIMRSVDAHIGIATSIFQDYGRDGNPLKDIWLNFQTALASGSYPPANSSKIPKSQDDLNKLILESAAYWLFRIRCCIAHNRIGEYVLTDTDVQFVLAFGEPLLKEIVSQVLANPNLPT